ncbi:tRNA pseudouridine(13) synthase TruD, partial [Campylobacter jejuni]|nr:tRNA pseudouridine(13) synthase TruD [Campylobacter jejuni]
GKCFLCEELSAELGRFKARDISAMGLLIGASAYDTGEGLALNLENEIFKDALEVKTKMQGSRRFMWGYLEELKWRDDKEKAHFCIEFF